MTQPRKLNDRDDAAEVIGRAMHDPVSRPNRWAPFSDAEVCALIDGMDAWDGETNALGRGQEPHSALAAELDGEARRRGMLR